MKLYSVLTCIFNNYEIVREVQNPDPLCDYVIITDDPNLRSSTWRTVVADDHIMKMPSAYYKYVYVKYHPFDFVDTEWVMWVDGSIQITDGNMREAFLDHMMLHNYDLMEIRNICNDNGYDEINRWAYHGFHGYTEEMARKTMEYTRGEPYGGLVQTTVYICKDTKETRRLNHITFDLCRMMGVDGDINMEIMDLRSWAIWHHFDIKKLLLLPPTLFCEYFDYKHHGSDESQYDLWMGNDPIDNPEPRLLEIENLRHDPEALRNHLFLIDDQGTMDTMYVEHLIPKALRNRC